MVQGTSITILNKKILIVVLKDVDESPNISNYDIKYIL